MKALQVKEPGVLRMIEKEKPQVENGNEVRLKVMAVGICGSDIHIYHGTNPMATYPRVIGHEIVGLVDAVGHDVKNVKVGDRVMLEPIEFCGECYACKQGRGNVCESLVVRGVHKDGGFQEYLVADSQHFFKLPDGIAFHQAVMIEPYTIGYQSNARGQVKSGDLVLIFGAGPTGLLAMDVAKEIGAKCIIVDLNDERLKRAEYFGADETINSGKEDLEKRVMAISNGKGANVVFDAVGNGAIFAQAIKLASVAGHVVSMGFVTEPAPISIVDITKKELDISGTRLQSDKFQLAIDNIMSKLDKLDQLITHQFNFDQYEEAFKLATSGAQNVGKIVVTFEEN